MLQYWRAEMSVKDTFFLFKTALFKEGGTLIVNTQNTRPSTLS